VCNVCVAVVDLECVCVGVRVSYVVLCAVL
jgi:hypothetical protein